MSLSDSILIVVPGGHKRLKQLALLQIDRRGQRMWRSGRRTNLSASECELRISGKRHAADGINVTTNQQQSISPYPTLVFTCFKVMRNYMGFSCGT